MSLRRFFSSALDEPWDLSHRFQTSWLLPPLWLATVRALCGLYALATLLATLIWDCTHDQQGCAAARNTFSYFTVLTYWGLASYLLVAAVYTAAHGLVLRNHDKRHPWIASLATPPRSLQATLGLLYSSIIVYPFVVTVVYWGFLYTAAHSANSTATTWRNVSQHALNSAFALVEIILPRTPLRPYLHLLVLLIVLALYLALAYITYATKGFYVYRFLDPSPAGVGSHVHVFAYVVGIAVFCGIMFFVAQVLVYLRRMLFESAAVREDEAGEIDLV